MADESTANAGPPPKRLKKELRKYSKLPIEVVENHDAVLYPIQRSIASKYLPFTGTTLVHFDAHPDLTIPAKMPAEWVFDTPRLAEAVSIADWILPAVYAGHINRVIWVKPEWADQMEGETRKFYIGRHKKTGYLRVTCKDDYFIEELLYAPMEELENTKQLEFIIFTLNSTLSPSETAKNTTYLEQVDKESPETLVLEREKVLDKEKELFKNSEFQIDKMNISFRSCAEPLVNLLTSMLQDCQAYILDIDMDFFSTKNPFKELFTEEEFQCLADVYRFTPPLTESEEDFNKCMQARSIQLDAIESTYKYVKQLDKGIEESCSDTTNINQQLHQLLKEIKSCGEGDKPDDEIIHSTGMTMDIPHHISTKQEIDNLLNLVYFTVTSLPKPTMVTMARSTYDEYSPPHQIDYIQDSLVGILGNIYGQDSIEINLDY